MNSTKAVFRAGDVLYGKLRPYLNKVVVPDFDGICSTDILVFRKQPWLDSRFLKYFLSTPPVVEFANHNSTGVQLPRIGFDTLGMLELPLPPLSEQRRIVAAVEAVLAKVNAARERLNRVPAILKRFRQSVLSAACSGRLTADWREKNPGATVSSEAVAKTTLLTSDDWPDELPDSWRVGNIAGLSAAVVDCPHSTPKWTSTGEICLRTTNFRAGCLDLSEVRYVSTETFNERISRLQPEPGDIVYSREGGILGIACMVPDGLRACLGQRMMLMRVHPWIHSSFLMHVLNCAATLAVVKDLTGGTASPHLNVGDVRAFRVPVPPLAEQQEIVRRVDKLFALVDVIEARLTDARRMADQLTQAVLAKAFRGELVPTEAALAHRENRTYEPAADLLARIRAGREQPASANGKPTRTATPKRCRKA